MFSPSSSIEIHLESDTFMVGDTIMGSIEFHTSSATDLATIDVSLEGVVVLEAGRKKSRRKETKLTHVSRRKDQKKSEIEHDGTDSDCEGDTVEEKVQILAKSVQVYPSEHASNLQGQELPPGSYTYKFAITVPEYCEGAKGSEWQHTKLPLSFTLPDKRGYVDYRINAVAHRPGRFARATRGHMPMRLLEFSEMSASAEVDRVCSHVGVDIFYDKQPRSRLMFNIRKSFGQLPGIMQHPITVELLTRSSGVPIGPSLTHLTDSTLLRDYLRILVYAPASNTTFFVTKIKAVLQGDFIVKAKEESDLYTIGYTIKDEKVGLPLVFKDGQADITHLIGDAAISGNMVPTLSLPQVSSSYQLKVNVTIGAGEPEAVVTTTAKVALHLALRKPDLAAGLYDTLPEYTPPIEFAPMEKREF